MLVGVQEGWGPAYMRAAYRLWFEHGVGNGGEENLRASLAECGRGQDVERILGTADSEDVGRALDLETDEARALGVFSSPTFAVGTELFWGGRPLGGRDLVGVPGPSRARVGRDVEPMALDALEAIIRAPPAGDGR